MMPESDPASLARMEMKEEKRSRMKGEEWAMPA
jgi:hypothetical protein